jgi:adenylate kinase
MEQASPKPGATSRNGFRTVFLGAPGAGKGTQAQVLGEGKSTLGPVAHISTGDMLRQHVAEQTPLGKQAKGYMDKGALVPDDLIIAMVEERLRKPDANGAWILDGFPRTVPQAQALDRSLAGLGKALSSVIYFRVPADVLVKRLTARWTCTQCGAIWNTEFRPTRAQGTCDTCGGRLAQRPDDRPEAVTKRLEVFRAQTEPLLSYYRGQNLLVELDANRPPEQVLSDLLTLATRV